MSEPTNPRDSPNVEPQSLRPAGHDVSSSNTEKEEDHYLVGESSYGDALRQEGTTRPKELSPESAHSHQTRSTGEPLLWHLGPKDKPIFDEGFEASTSSERAERWKSLWKSQKSRERREPRGTSKRQLSIIQYILYT